MGEIFKFARSNNFNSQEFSEIGIIQGCFGVVKNKARKVNVARPQGELYEVIEVNDNNTYDLAKYSAYTYEYSPGGLSGGTNFGADLWLPEGQGTNYGARLDSVVSILPGRKNKLVQGDMVEVCFYDRDRQRPYIKRLLKRGVYQFDAGGLISFDLALWHQAEGMPFLSWSTLSAPIHPFSGSTNVLWTGTSVAGATPFGIVVSADGKVITAQGLRDSGDTFWEKVKISLQIPFGAVENIETTMSVSPSFWYTAMWTNADASFIIAADIANRQIWRKRGSMFQQVTLTDLSSFELITMNVSPLGHIMLPEYSRTAAQTYTVTAPYTNPAATTIVDGISTPTGSHKCRAWNLNIDATTVPRSWELDPASQLQSALPIVNGLIYGGTGNGQAPCSIYGTEFVTWASGRPRLPAVTPYNQASLVRFIPVPSNVPTAYSPAVSKSVEGVLMGISATAGSVTWTHRITITATNPSDYGLLGPLDTWLAANYVTIQGAHHTYYGVCGQEALTANVPGGSGPTILTSIYFPDYNITWNGPDYAVFFDAAVVMLPRDAANTTQPRDIGGSLNNIGVFTDYIQPGVLGTIDQTLGVVGDKDGNYYFAYLEPVGLKVGGIAGAGMGVTNGCWGDFAGHTTIDPFAFPMTRGAYLVPDIVNTYRRKLRKISNSGSLLLEYDLTQLLTASWYELESTLWTGFPDNAIGGSSSSGVPMADNVWKISPCGRVVFVILDYHGLGANYQPQTKLQILDANSTTILHTIELINELGLSTIASNIYGTDSTTEYFVGDGTTDTFTLTEIPINVISAMVDGSSEAYTQSGADIIFSSPPGSGLDVVIEYEYSDVNDLIWRSGERRYYADPLSMEIRSGFSSTGETEWAAIEVQAVDRTGASSPSAKTYLVEMGALITDTPSLTIGNSTGAGRSTISAGTFLKPAYSSGQWKIIQTV